MKALPIKYRERTVPLLWAPLKIGHEHAMEQLSGDYSFEKGGTLLPSAGEEPRFSFSQ